MHDYVLTFTSYVTKIGMTTLCSWGLKSIHQSYKIHIYFPMIASYDKSDTIIVNSIGYKGEIPGMRGPSLGQNSFLFM